MRAIDGSRSEGIAITLVTPREQRQLRLIERVIGRRIKATRLPTLADVAARPGHLEEAAIGSTACDYIR